MTIEIPKEKWIRIGAGRDPGRTMVSRRLEFGVVSAGVDAGSVEAGAGFAFSITNTAVVRAGTVKELLK